MDNKKLIAIFIYADGFEDTEAIASRDVLVRAGFQVFDYVLNSTGEVTSSHGMKFVGKYIKDLPLADVVVLPGGSRGVQNLLKSSCVDEMIQNHYKNGKLVCAICAAPMVLGKNGLLKGLPFTCYPGCEEGLEGNYTGNEVVVTDRIITARSMLYSIPFGLAIIEKMMGKEKRDLIYKQIAGIR